VEPTRRPLALRERPGDWFLVVAFGAFAFTSIFSDSLVARGIPLAPDSPSFWARANYWYAAGTDPHLLDPPLALRLQTGISAFVFGPFYLLLVYAFVTARDWIRMPAILYVAAIEYSMMVFLGGEFLGPLPPTNLRKFLAFNAPYVMIPLLLAVRMRRARPFSD